MLIIIVCVNNTIPYWIFIMHIIYAKIDIKIIFASQQHNIIILENHNIIIAAII